MRPFFAMWNERPQKRCSPGLNCWASKSDAWTHNKLRLTEETHGSSLNMELRKQDGKYYEPLKLEVTALLLSLLWNMMAAGDRTLMENSLPGPTNTATSKGLMLHFLAHSSQPNKSKLCKQNIHESLRKCVSVYIQIIYIYTYMSCYVLNNV